MAQPAHGLQDDHMLREYLRLLARYGGTPDRRVSPGHQIRTCAACGQEALFHVDPEGVWGRCSRCGHYA